MDEMEMLFSCFDEKEVDELLRNIKSEENPDLAYSIKKRLGIKQAEKSKVIPIPLKKILPVAASFILVVALAAVFGLTRNQAQIQPSSTTTTQPAPEENPLMTAISTGNDDVIATLLSLPGLISEETLDFALNFSNLLSYDTISQIALSVREKLGTTGLDGLLEGALFGDSQKVLDELEKRDQMLMTPFEKLAFFFTVAFCDSEAVDEFVKCGYDVNEKDAAGNSIYAIAKKYGNTDTMQYAVSKGITY